MMSLPRLDAQFANFNNFRFNGGQNKAQSANPYGYLANGLNPKPQILNQPTVPFGNNSPYYAGQNTPLANNFSPYYAGQNTPLANNFSPYYAGHNAPLANNFSPYYTGHNAPLANNFSPYYTGHKAPLANNFSPYYTGHNAPLANNNLSSYFTAQNTPWGNSFRYQLEPPPPLRMPEGVNAIAGNQDFKTLTTALGAAGLVDALKGLESKNPITVLAPTEAAFGKVDPKLLQSLLKPENKAFLQQILQYHVSDMKFPLNQQAGKARFDSLLSNNNDETVINLKNGQLSLVNGAQKIQGSSPIKAPNGSTVIPVDQVLIPPGFDVDALNADKTNAVSFLKTNKNSSTLFAAIGAADLGGAVGNLEGTKPITILAPSEAAFKKLDPKLLTALLKPENKGVLQEILQYHVSAAKSEQGTFDSLLNNQDDQTRIETAKNGQTVIVNGRQVVQGANAVTTSNGSKIITIDEVLIPPSVNLSNLL